MVDGCLFCERAYEARLGPLPLCPSCRLVLPFLANLGVKEAETFLEASQAPEATMADRIRARTALVRLLVKPRPPMGGAGPDRHKLPLPLEDARAEYLDIVHQHGLTQRELFVIGVGLAAEIGEKVSVMVPPGSIEEHAHRMGHFLETMGHEPWWDTRSWYHVLGALYIKMMMAFIEKGAFGMPVAVDPEPKNESAST